MKKYLEAGRLTSARGLKGELRFDCWCDGPEFLSGVERLYLDEKGENELEVEIYRPSIPSFIFVGSTAEKNAWDLRGRSCTSTGAMWSCRTEDIITTIL